MIVCCDQDQLDNSDGGREEMEWLPETLPPHVSIVVSTLPVIGGCWSALQRKGIVGPCPLTASDAPPQTNVEVVRQLAESECLDIIHAWLKKDGRALTTAQFTTLSEAVLACPLPLFVKLAYDRTRRWRSFHEAEVSCCDVKC